MIDCYVQSPSKSNQVGLLLLTPVSSTKKIVIQKIIQTGTTVMVSDNSQQTSPLTIKLTDSMVNAANEAFVVSGAAAGSTRTYLIRDNIFTNTSNGAVLANTGPASGVATFNVYSSGNSYGGNPVAANNCNPSANCNVNIYDFRRAGQLERLTKKRTNSASRFVCRFFWGRRRWQDDYRELLLIQYDGD